MRFQLDKLRAVNVLAHKDTFLPQFEDSKFTYFYSDASVKATILKRVNWQGSAENVLSFHID